MYHLLKLIKLSVKKKQNFKQECNPVGCVPSAAVAISPRGECLPQCMLGYQPPGTRPPPPDQAPPTPQDQAPPMSGPPRPGTPFPPPPPPRGQTHACEKITFATSLWMVKILKKWKKILEKLGNFVSPEKWKPCKLCQFISQGPNYNI